MLVELKIQNLVVIEKAQVPFRDGLNILSGETGAGKSVVLAAIGLLLGSRAQADLVRGGTDELSVEGLFDLSHLPWMSERLAQHGIEPDGTDLLVKRTVHKNGKSRIFINGQLATLSMLQSICEGLVDLCGQHEHQSLLKSSVQLELLDRYGGLTEKGNQYQALFQNWKALKKELQCLLESQEEHAKRLDFLKFQLQELEEASLSPHEEEELAQEKTLLQSATNRLALAESVRQLLDSNDSERGSGVLSELQHALNKAKQLASLDSTSESLASGLERATAEVEEASLHLARYLQSVEVDPERLQTVLDRLGLIADFKRKYGGTIREMLDTQNRLASELSQISNFDESRVQLEKKVQTLETELRKLAGALSKARKSVAKTLSESVSQELHELKMEDAVFTLQVTTTDSSEDWNERGADQVTFLIQTNRGETPKPLSKVASGGELSRLMLSIRRVIADRGGIGVYLFDEIDAGMGGQTAFQVGKKLKSVAKYNQVICITHLPQVAAFADHHLVVEKQSQGAKTRTDILEVQGEPRKEELARMLGGPKLTKKSLENASELLSLAR